MERYYFDYAAATPLDPRVEKAMRPYWSQIYGNPGALHWFGQQASAAVFEARQKIAEILGCHYKEIIFTSGATEANNLALRGIIKGLGFRVEGLGKEKKPKIIVSAIEHESVLETAKDLEKEGAEIVYLPVDKNGFVDLKKLKSALDERTVLVSVMYANNEIGTIQPILEIAEIIRNFKEAKSQKGKDKSSTTLYPLFHTDAVQAFNYLDCNVQRLGVDLMTLSSQKIYGPKGVGLLYVKGLEKNKLTPSPSTFYPAITGGGQESGLRGGTENVAGIVGFAKAMEIVEQIKIEESRRIQALRDYFLKKIKKIIPQVQINGGEKRRLPNNINIYLPRYHSQDLLIKLDLAGFAVSPGAACSARVCAPSHVLKALGCSDEQAENSLRITFGRQTDKKSIDQLLATIKNMLY